MKNMTFSCSLFCLFSPLYYENKARHIKKLYLRHMILSTQASLCVPYEAHQHYVLCALCNVRILMTFSLHKTSTINFALKSLYVSCCSWTYDDIFVSPFKTRDQALCLINPLDANAQCNITICLWDQWIVKHNWLACKWISIRVTAEDCVHCRVL